MSPDDVTVILLNGSDPLIFSSSQCSTAEDVCFEVAKRCQIGTVARHLFALRRPDGTWVSPCCILAKETSKVSYELRMRFQVPDVAQLQAIDFHAMDYYFYQIRQDFLNGFIPEALKSQEKILGLAVTDMYRVSLEKNLTREMIEKDYKKYLPKETVKNIFLVYLGARKAMHKTLVNLESRIKDPSYVKIQYVNQLNKLAPQYGCEEYDALIDKDGAVMEVTVSFEPFNKEKSGLWIHTKSKKKVQHFHVCTIEELCFISMRNDNTVEISRKNGVPQYFMFNSTSKMHSFIGVLDGYYRLMEKWIFNLCKDFPTPFIHVLRSMKCHGPVGRAFAYKKLETKRNNRPGCYIVRQGWQYDTYRLDVCREGQNIPETWVILETPEGFTFEDPIKCYPTISELLASYNEQRGEIIFKECIPPSEYDDSSLLLCKIRALESGECNGTPSFSQEVDNRSSQCINPQQIRLEKMFEPNNSRCTAVLRGTWIRSGGTGEIQVALKSYKRIKNDCSKIEEFLQMANTCVFWHCDSIVTFYGVTLLNPLALVMEYLPLGPLNIYLQQNQSQIQEVDLVEAAVYLGKALWYLEEQGVVHGNICCKNLLMVFHDETSFKIKLADPGIDRKNRLHWIPPECYDNPTSAFSQMTADVWAFGTTLWEIFSFGRLPFDGKSTHEEVAYYRQGGRLPIPNNCNSDVFKLMTECWCRDPDSRKKPQAIVRDINQTLYEVHNSRRLHSYATLESKSCLSNSSSSLNIENQSTTPIAACVKENIIQLPKKRSVVINDNSESFNKQLSSDDVLSQLYHLSLSPSNHSLESMVQDEWIIENGHLEMIKKIGEGFYGEVYQAKLNRYAGLAKEVVAVKQLKATCELAGHHDLLREISIMKSLQHKNIVKIKGVVEDPKTLLVMEFMEMGSMLVHIKTHKERLSEKLLLKFSLDIAEGMEYLEEKRIVHRDLAARNILVASEDTVKISDFGLAQKIGMKDYYKLKTDRDLPVRWYAPESIRTWKFTSKSDVWSFGITLWEMFSHGKEPVIEGCKDGELLKVLEEGKRLCVPGTCSLSIYTDLMKMCWDGEPEKRLSFTQLRIKIKNLYDYL